MAVEFPVARLPRLFITGYLLAGGIALGFAAYIARRRPRDPTARAFGAVSVLVAIWSFGYVFRLLAPTLSGKLLWTQVAWIGVTLAPVGILVFALRFTGYGDWLTRSRLAALLVIPFTTQLVLATNSIHGLFYSAVWLYAEDVVPVLASQGGVWFYGVHLPYIWAVYLSGTALIVRFALSARHAYRAQSIALVVGALIPWVVNGTYLAGIRTHPMLDPTPIGIAAGLAVVALAAFRADFLGIVPVARERVLDEVDEAVFVFDDANRLVDVNDAGERFLDDTRAESGETWSLGNAAGDLLPAVLDRAGPVEHGVDEESETSSEDPAEVRVEIDGEERWYLVRYHDIGSVGVGSVGADSRGWILTLTDITEQQRQLELLERRNDQLKQVASIMSHDLRGPLNVASGYRRRLADRLDEGDLSTADREELATWLDTVASTHDRMDDIIDDVLTLTRSGQEITDAEPVELASLARLAWTHVRTDDVALVVDDSRQLVGDENRLLRVFENLFRNTVTHGDGATTIRVGTLSDGFYVEDDGEGIPPDRRDEVFDPGTTTADDGTGLGLSIVRAVVEAHGWRIEVLESAAGGTRFEVTGVDGETNRSGGA